MSSSTTTIEYEGVVTATQSGVIVTVDLGTCRLLGYDSPTGLVGQNVKVSLLLSTSFIPSSPFCSLAPFVLPFLFRG